MNMCGFRTEVKRLWFVFPLVILSATHTSLMVCQSVGVGYGKAADLAKLPYLDISTADRARQSSQVTAREVIRAQRYNSHATEPLFNEKNPAKSGYIHFSQQIEHNGSFDPLYTKEADLVAIGEITAEAVHMSADKGSVYSTFNFVPSCILRGSEGNAALLLERKGGQVLFPSGEKRIIGVRNWGVPVPGYQYLFLLKRTHEGDSYNILGGFAFVDGRVISLDADGKSLNSLSEEALLKEIKKKTSR